MTDDRAINYKRAAMYLIGALLIMRVIGLFISPLGLHGDEAQYWSWSQDPDWGYFSKPPMIAWMIAATTSIFGHAEWAVRLSSPILHSVTGFLIFRLTARIYDGRTGFWASAVYLLMPAVWLSSGIASTDVSLLMFWIIALSGWYGLRSGGGIGAGSAFRSGHWSGTHVQICHVVFYPAIADCGVI